MTIRPILFSAPMVRALLEGRKTQTRRIITPNNLRIYTGGLDYPGSFVKPDQATFEAAFNNARKFRRIEHTMSWVTDPVTHQIGAVMSQWTGRVAYSVGDRLWVREAWAPLTALTHNDPGTQALADGVFYKADNSTVEGEVARWHPSIHMPRKASRITLEIADVRIERLNDCSDADAIAEGILSSPYSESGWLNYWNPNGVFDRPLHSYASLWDEINGEGEWDKNPWVAAYTFHVINRNIDQIEVAA